MTAVIDENGLQIQTFSEILEEVGADMVAQGFPTELETSFGQLRRIWSELEAHQQEKLLQVYNLLSLFTDGVALERVVLLHGVRRRPAQRSIVSGIARGTPSHTITEGTILTYGPTGATWEVIADTTLDIAGRATLLLQSVDIGEPHVVNVGRDYTGVLTGTSGGPNAIGEYTLNFNGFGLAAPTDVTYTAMQPPSPPSIVEGMRQRLLVETAQGGDIEGVVLSTRRENVILQIWTSAGGVITFDSVTFETPSMVIEEHQVWAISGDPDFLSFTAEQQGQVGSPTESDASLRVRATVEAFSRGQGPLKAIESSIAKVPGNTFRRVWENTGHPDSFDANGIQGRSINIVVDGGLDDDIVQAILTSRGGGVQMVSLHSAPFGYSETVSLGDGRTVDVAFDRVVEVPIWIQFTATYTLLAPPDVQDVIANALLEGATRIFDIGDDVQPWRLYSVVKMAGIPGIDTLLIEVSEDNGGVPLGYVQTNLPITVRQRADFSIDRIEAA
jgi:hypothetical protein